MVDWIFASIEELVPGTSRTEREVCACLNTAFGELNEDADARARVHGPPRSRIDPPAAGTRLRTLREAPRPEFATL
jgi:hypothetical protein